MGEGVLVDFNLLLIDESHRLFITSYEGSVFQAVIIYFTFIYRSEDTLLT